jgi:hypothetical protein
VEEVAVTVGVAAPVPVVRVVGQADTETMHNLILEVVGEECVLILTVEMEEMVVLVLLLYATLR